MNLISTTIAPTTTTRSLQRRIAGSAALVMASVILSQALGFLREWTLARKIGSNSTTDAYYAAFTLPNFLSYLVAGASLSVIFIPVFTKYVAEQRESEAWHIFSTVMTFMGLLLVALIAIGEIFASQLVQIIAPGFPPAQKEQVVFLTRLMLPAQFCLVIGSILSSVQYAKNQFFFPSLASVIYNVMVVLCGWLLSTRIGITGFAVGVLAGAIIGNFILQIYGASRAGASFRPNLDLRHPGFRLFLKMAIPIMLALSLTFTDDWVIRWFGSYLPPASITWLSYAKTLMRVPLTAVGQAVGIASFPILARLYSEKKVDELNYILNSSLKGLFLLVIPISALTVALSSPVVYLVFSHTRLRGTDFQATAFALALFSLGMFGWGGQFILVRGFYATRNTWTPALVGTAVTVLSLPFYSYLVHRYQYAGLAVASSCGIVFYMLVLFALLIRHTKNREAASIVRMFLKTCVASCLAALACFYFSKWLESHLAWQTTHGALLVLLLGSAVGFPLTAVLAKILKVRELDQFLQTFLRRRTKLGTPVDSLMPLSVKSQPEGSI